MKIHNKMYLLFNLNYGIGKSLKSIFHPHLPSGRTAGDGRAQSFGSFSCSFLPREGGGVKGGGVKDSRAAEVIIIRVSKIIMTLGSGFFIFIYQLYTRNVIPVKLVPVCFKRGVGIHIHGTSFPQFFSGNPEVL